MQSLGLNIFDKLFLRSLLDKGVNRSVGAQLSHQLKDLLEGTKVTRVVERGQ